MFVLIVTLLSFSLPSPLPSLFIFLVSLPPSLPPSLPLSSSLPPSLPPSPPQLAVVTPQPRNLTTALTLEKWVN